MRSPAIFGVGETLCMILATGFMYWDGILLPGIGVRVPFGPAVLYGSGQPLEFDELEVLPPAGGEVRCASSQVVFTLLQGR